jgi:hypothetical protein
MNGREKGFECCSKAVEGEAGEKGFSRECNGHQVGEWSSGAELEKAFDRQAWLLPLILRISIAFTSYEQLHFIERIRLQLKRIEFNPWVANSSRCGLKHS